MKHRMFFYLTQILSSANCFKYKGGFSLVKRLSQHKREVDPISGNIGRWKKIEKGPPIYGYYEGDHIYGIQPVVSAIQSGEYLSYGFAY